MKTKTEELLGKFTANNLDHCPILELGARVWEEERYLAFKTCYQTMRRVDDLVDHRKSLGGEIAGPEKQALQDTVKAWMLAKTPSGHPAAGTLQQVREKFRLPEWPWQRWTRAMLYDLDHDGFATFTDYLRYSEGAAVAPGAIFMHLCALRRENGSYAPPAFDARRAARPLALFAYLVHIVRDFQSDHLQNLNYFAEDLLARHGLGRRALREIAGGGPVPPGFRALLRDYLGWAQRYRQKARAALDAVSPQLESPYALSLEIIYELYRQIFERLNPDAASFAAAETVPTCPEVLARIRRVILEF